MTLRAHVLGIVAIALLPMLLATGLSLRDRDLQSVAVVGVRHAILSPPWPLLAIAIAMAASLGLAAWLSRRLCRPLPLLVQNVLDAAVGTGPARDSLARSSVAEFEALRLGIVRADAALRRRIEAERVALREARTGHELLDSVLNATAECIWVKDLELRFVLINRAARMMRPEPIDEWQVLGRFATDLFPAQTARRIELADRAVLSSGRMTSFELDIDWPDGSGATRWMWMTITPWQDAGGRVVGIVSVSRDITDWRAAGIRMRSMQADLLRATRLSAMGAMASGLAHELNQPLAAATNYLNASARLLERRAAVADEDLICVRGAVIDGAQQVLRAGGIVRRLRDFVGRGEAELQHHDLGQLIRGAVDLAKADGVTGGVTFRTSLAPGDLTVLVDQTQMQQVLLNLIRNAAEALEAAKRADPLRPASTIILATSIASADSICIDVIDNGPGLDPSVTENLFEPFVSTKPGGMGIGLTICPPPTPPPPHHHRRPWRPVAGGAGRGLWHAAAHLPAVPSLTQESKYECYDPVSRRGLPGKAHRGACGR